MIIKAYSKAKYSTWIYYSPLSLLFDAGEGINCFMEEKLVTISNIFLSHGHTDHYTGLINILMTKLAHFNNSGVVFPTSIFYPENDITLQKYIDYIIE
jgi:ribonuclease Z